MLARIIGTWGKPPDAVATWALVLAAALLALALSSQKTRASWMPHLPPRFFLLIAAFAAAALSLGYVAQYLRGGPRIIDASTYWLQARALSQGHFAWTVPEPSASFRGRFLLFDAPDHRLAGIFPPGYPAILAMGFLVGAPMIVGPALAAGIAIATYTLAKVLAREAAAQGMTTDASYTDRVARIGAGFSLVCATLRYHTADTMAHGASALGIALALASALHARHLPASHRRPFFALAGVCIGGVIATRTVSALPIACVALALAWGAPPIPGARRAGGRWPAIAWTLLGTLPGLALLLLAQRASLGDAFASTQRAYYAVSDGPAGCFRYGFGRGVGCLFEHGEFARAHDLDTDGYGFVAALGTTGRRLKMHLTDVANLEPLALLVLVPILHRTTRALRGVRASTALVLGHVLAYAPFYFDGNYPGGGARFFADVLPIEHALLAMSLAVIAPSLPLATKGLAALALSLAGFAVHASFDHVALANRDGGRPLYEPVLAREAGFTHGILFVESDHAFGLAHNPDAANAPNADERLVVARLRHDDHDRLLVESLGWPRASVYRLKDAQATPGATVGDLMQRPSIGDAGSPKTPMLDPFTAPPATGSNWRFEAESDWPPLAQHGGWAEPIWATTTCASNGQALALHAEASESDVAIALPSPRKGHWRITPRLLFGQKNAAGTLRVLRDGTELAAWSWPASESTQTAPARQGAPERTCRELETKDVALPDQAPLTLVFSLINAREAGASPAYPQLDKTSLAGPR